MKIWEGAYLKRIKCDFMIWTPEMSLLLQTMNDASHTEYSLFRGLKPEIFTANLVNMRNAIRNGPLVAFLKNLDDKLDGGVIEDIDLMGILTPDIKTKKVMTKYNENNSELKTSYILQLGKRYSDEESLNRILRKHYTEGFNATEDEILNTISWRYFPRWSPEEMGQGRHWQVLYYTLLP